MHTSHLPAIRLESKNQNDNHDRGVQKLRNQVIRKIQILKCDRIDDDYRWRCEYGEDDSRNHSGVVYRNYYEQDGLRDLAFL